MPPEDDCGLLPMQLWILLLLAAEHFDFDIRKKIETAASIPPWDVYDPIYE